MDDLVKYNEVFMDVFGVSEEDLGDSFTSEEVEAWDSVGHMNLVSELEETFDIYFEDEEILLLQSYSKGIEILRDHGIDISE